MHFKPIAATFGEVVPNKTFSEKIKGAAAELAPFFA
jgi:hypothetical protein